MQPTFKSSNTKSTGFQARTSAPAAAKSATPANDAGTKKTSGEVVFRVKRKGVEGEINQQGQPTKWVTVGNLYKNTDLATGDVFYSFQAKEAIAPGIHRTFDATAPVGTN